MHSSSPLALAVTPFRVFQVMLVGISGFLIPAFDDLFQPPVDSPKPVGVPPPTRTSGSPTRTMLVQDSPSPLMVTCLVLTFIALSISVAVGIWVRSPQRPADNKSGRLRRNDEPPPPPPDSPVEEENKDEEDEDEGGDGDDDDPDGTGDHHDQETDADGHQVAQAPDPEDPPPPPTDVEHDDDDDKYGSDDWPSWLLFLIFGILGLKTRKGDSISTTADPRVDELQAQNLDVATVVANEPRPVPEPPLVERTADVGVCPNLPPTPREVSSTIKSVPTAAYDPPVAQQSATTPKPATSTGQPRPSGTAPQSLRPFLWNFFKWAVVLPTAGVVSTILCFVVFPYPPIVFDDDQPPPPPLNVPELPPPPVPEPPPPPPPAPVAPPPPAPVAPQLDPAPPPAPADPPPPIPPALDAPQPVTAPPPAPAPPPPKRRDAGLKLLDIITTATNARIEREEGPGDAALQAQLLAKTQRRVYQTVVTRAAMPWAPESDESDAGEQGRLQMIQKLVSKSAAFGAARLAKEEEKVRVERIEEVQRRLWRLRAELKEGEV